LIIAMKKVTNTISKSENEVEDMTEEKTDKIIELLEEISRWVKFEGIQRATDVFAGLLKTDTERLVYESSDGRTSREIAQVVGTSHATVINYWKKWAKHGIVREKASRGGTRFVKVFSLTDFGIEIPRITKKERTVEKEPRDRNAGSQEEPSERLETETEGDFTETKETLDKKSPEEVQK